MKRGNSSSGNGIVYLLVAIVSAFWGLSFLVTSILVQYLEPIQIQTVRWTIAAAIFIVMMMTGKLRIDLRKPHVKYLLATAACEPCSYMIFETYGIKLTSSSIGSIFVATIPSMVLLMNAVFLHRKTSFRGVVSIIMAFVGVAVCTVFSPAFSISGNALGYIMMMGAVIVGGLYALVSKEASIDYTSTEITATMALVGTVYFNALNVVLGYGKETYTIYFTHPKLFLCVAFLGVCCSAVCYLAFNKLINMTDPAIANNMSASMTTIVGVVAGIFIAGDPGGVYTVIGLALTLTGVILSSREIS